MDERQESTRLLLVSSMTPASQSRAWLSTPHPSLPIIATCTSDKDVRIYSLTSFTQLSTITGGHKRSIRSCAWKPNLQGQSTLATGSFDATIGLWSKEDEGVGVKETDFTSSGQGENDDEDEDEEWRYALVLDGHDSEVKSVSWSAGGNYLATCSRDKSVWVWEEVGEEDYETIAVLEEHSADVKTVAWHPEEVMIASGGYDDDIRLWKEDLDDWTCMGLLQGHESTVWMVEWEGLSITEILMASTNDSKEKESWIERRKESGPRLASCSDDKTIRIWRRKPRHNRVAQNPLSIIQTSSIEEDWVEEAKLPQVHDREIYAISWSRKTGRIVSSGGDGKVIVYEERWRSTTEPLVNSENRGEGRDPPQDAMEGVTITDTNGAGDTTKTTEATEWVVVTELENAHDVFEINHVVWARRADRGKRKEGEEIIVTTGDDGAVKVWSLES